MVDRYWVGGTGTWSSTVGTTWATSSGGAGGASVPGSGDKAIFDASSGAGTVTKAATALTIGSLDMTGSSVTVDFASRIMTVDTGNVTLISTAGTSWTFTGTADQTLTTNGASQINIIRGGASGTTQKLILGDALIMSGTLTLNRASIDLNGFDILIQAFTSNGTTTRSLIMAGRTMTLFGAWTQTSTTGFTLTTPGTVKFDGTANSGYTVVAGITLPDTQLTSGSLSQTYTFDTASAVTSLKVLHAANSAFNSAMILSLVQALTVNGNLEVISGTAFSQVSIQSSVAAAARTLTVSGAAILRNCVFTDITAAGTTPFTACRRSSLVSNNTNIVIGGIASSDALMGTTL